MTSVPLVRSAASRWRAIAERSANPSHGGKVKDFDLKVLGAVAEHCSRHPNRGPSVRDIGIAVGWPHPKEIWQALQRLAAVGVIDWPVDAKGRRVKNGVRLAVPISEPFTVPVLGPGDYVPGSKYIEFTGDGIFLVMPDGTRHECRAVEVK
jgi:hypothetical protein